MQARHSLRRRRFRRSIMELCEERRLLVCDVFTPESMFGDDGVLQQLQQVIDDAAYVGRQIPFIGERLVDSAPFGLDIRQELLSVYDAAEGEIGDRLETAFNQVLGAENYAFLDQIVDVNFDSDTCTVTATIDLSRQLATWESPGFDFDFGLDSLPFYLSGDFGGVELSLGFDLSPFAIALDLNTGDVDLDTNGTTFELQLSAELQDGASLTAQIGFLEMSISDGLGAFPAEDQRSELTYGVNVDFGPNFSIDSTQFNGHAQLLLHMESTVNENLPLVSADFVLQQDLTSNASPNVEFQNVSVGLGDLATKFLGPVVDLLEPVIDPIARVTGLLTNPIPVISDLGLGDVSVMDIANGLADQGALPADYTAYVKLTDVFTKVIGFLDMIEGPECTAEGCTQVQIDLGSLSLSDLNGDLRTIDPKVLEPSPTDVSLSGLSIGNFAELDSLIERVESIDGLDPGIKQVLLNGLQDLDDELSQGASIAFPILSNPAGVIFQWLVGQNADLFTAEADITLGESDVDLSGPLPVGVDGGLRGGFSPSVKLGLGYDTFGLRRFLENRRQGTDSPVDLLDGFYITDDSELSIKGWLEAYVQLNALVFSVDASGGISAGIVAAVVGSDEDPSLPNEDNEPEKVRFLSEMGPCAFDLSGQIDAQIALTARLGVQLGPVFIGVEDRWELAHFEIASFDLGCVGNPYFDTEDPVQLGEVDDAGVLTLYAGPSGGLRSIAATKTDEVFQVLPGPTGGSVQVNAFGVSQVFQGVNQIVADMGSGFDSVNIAEGVTADVVIHGGDEFDILRSFGSGSATLYGDNGDDLLQGGTGPNYLFGGAGSDLIFGVGSADQPIEIDGGDGDDNITGGVGANQLVGGPGNDQVTGGQGPNRIEGGIGNDLLFGGPNDDQIFGGAGDDRITAGPGQVTIDAGIGHDTIFSGAGSAIVEGGEGDDLLAWEFGDGPVQFSGGLGFDSIGMIGSASTDTFVMTHQAGGVRLLGPSVLGPVELAGLEVEQLSVDGMQGADRILVQPLTGSSVQRVNINLSDNLARDGQEDLISIHGTPIRDELLVENVEVSLMDTPTHVPPVIGGVMRISGFRSHPLTIDDHYEIFAMNFGDRLLVNSHDANDLLTVRGVTGPTFLNTSSGDDHVLVEAVEPFVLEDESGDFLSDVHVNGGAGANSLSVVETGTNVGDEILVTDRTVSSNLLPGVHFGAADAGTFGGGVNITAGGHDDEIQISGTLRASITSVDAGAGDDHVLVDSQVGDAEGDLNQIRGPLVIDGGSGQSLIELIDTSDGNPTAETVIHEVNVGAQTAMQVAGFAGPSDDVPIRVIDDVDVELVLRGSQQAGVSESYQVRATILGTTRIEDQAGDASYVIERTRGRLEIVGDAGDEVIQVTPTTQSWGNLIGNISVDAGPGNDRVEVSDQATAELTFYELTATTLSRGPAFTGTIEFDDGLELLRLDGASVNDSFTVQALPTTTEVEVDQHGGGNIAVGPATGAQWTILGPNVAQIGQQVRVTNAATIASGGGDNTFSMTSAGSISGAIFGTVAGHDILDYSGVIGPVTINLAQQTATNVAAFQHLDQFVGGAADDLLVGPDADTNWTIEGIGMGTLQVAGDPAIRSFSSIERLTGGTSTDQFLMAPAGQLKSVSGGGGVDRVNYALFSTDVTIDLQAGTANNLEQLMSIENATGGAGNDLIRGSSGANVLRGLAGHDILVGRGGNDTLEGSLGNDVLIGGTGADTLQGGQDSDLLIAAATTYDDTPVSLEVIRSIWSDDRRTYLRRISDLTSPLARTQLTNTTVLTDRQVDDLFGNGDIDWFWTDPTDVLHDLQAGEQVVESN